MLKFLLIAMLVGISSNVMAEWSSIGTSSVYSYTLYVDLSTTSRTGNKVKVWSLKDYPTEQVKNYLPVPFLSEKEYYEVNCGYQSVPLPQWLADVLVGHKKEERIRTTIYTSKNMGEGSVIASFVSDLDSDWKVIPQDDPLMETFIKLVCDKN